MNRKIVITMALFLMVALTAGMVVFTIMLRSESAQQASSDDDSSFPPVFMYIILAALFPGVIAAVSARRKGDMNKNYAIIGAILAVGGILVFLFLLLIFFGS